MEIGILLVAFFSFMSGLLVKGVNITINHKNEEAPKEYNESTEQYLDPEVRVYMEQNNGNYKF